MHKSVCFIWESPPPPRVFTHEFNSPVNFDQDDTRLALERDQKRDEAKRTSFKTTVFYNYKFCVVR